MAADKTSFEIRDNTLFLQGMWTINRAERLLAEMEQNNDANYARIDTAAVEKIDSWGAYYLKKLAKDAGADLQITDQQKKLFDFLPENEKPKQKDNNETSLITSLFENIGERWVNFAAEFFGIFSFLGQTSIRFLKNFASPRAFRFHSVVRHIDETGIRAIPIIGLLAVLISMVISYQAATQLQKFGANIFTVDLTVISLLREMAVLVTAIMVAGRSGSAFAAEIGVMKLREEVDALRTIGMDPIEVLVLPRILALVITLPILTFIADLVGIAGGAIISMTLLDIPLDQYIDRVQMVAKPEMFFVGLVKAPVFAFIIAIIGTYQGMNISGSAESVGRLTTVSVVQSIFIVIAADALFSILFANLGI